MATLSIIDTSNHLLICLLYKLHMNQLSIYNMPDFRCELVMCSLPYDSQKCVFSHQFSQKCVEYGDCRIETTGLKT